MTLSEQSTQLPRRQTSKNHLPVVRHKTFPLGFSDRMNSLLKIDYPSTSNFWGPSSCIQQRRRRRQIGQKLARKRAFSNPGEVVYRRPEDWTEQQSYSDCIFLDEHDTCLASDHRGHVDILRLPRYGSSLEEPHILASKVPIGCGYESCQVNSNHIKFKSVQGGKAFAVGLPSGNYHVVATERASDMDINNYSSKSCSIHEVSRSSYIKAMINFEGPRRRFIRNLNSSSLTLSQMIDKAVGTLNLDLNGLEEANSWNTNAWQNIRNFSIDHFLPNQCVSNSALWDFRDTASTVLAAHIDSELDCFWLRLMDDRIQQTTMCVDTTSRDKLIGFEEHIVACSFASEYSLATSHISTCQNSTKSGNCILKFWDIRMVHRRKESTLSEIILPSFPNDFAVPLKPTALLSSSDQMGEAMITKLSSPAGTPGIMIATSQSSSSYTIHYVIDLGRLSCTKTICHENQGRFPIHGIASSHEFMACLGGEKTDSIYVYDLHQAHPTAGSRKRTVDGGMRDDLNDGKDKSWCYMFTPELKDRHGLQTQLSCLAMNDSGTSILGGSNDGDIFVWR